MMLEASSLGWGRRPGLVLRGPMSSFQIKVNFACHLEIKVPESGRSGEAQNPCCLKSGVNAKVPKTGSMTVEFLCQQNSNHKTQTTKWAFFSRGRWKNTRPNNADDRKAAIKATWSSITPQQCHSVITSMPCCITAVIQTNGGPVKYRVHRHELSLK